MSQKAVFISGAAQGIGQKTAIALARSGWIVGAYDISSDFDWIHTEEVPKGSIISGYLDVTKPESWQEALKDFTTQTSGKLHALINNAGILYAGPFMEEGSFEKDSAAVDVNVKGVVFGARAAYPYLKATEGSRLLNVCSASAIYGIPDMSVYSTTKFAIRGFTEAIEQEWEEDGILVNSVMPLYAKTGMLENVSTTGTQRLGVRLTAEDVAKEIAKVVESSRRTPIQVHYPIGGNTKVLHALASITPNWLLRYVNAKLTSGRKISF